MRVVGWVPERTRVERTSGYGFCSRPLLPVSGPRGGVVCGVIRITLEEEEEVQ